MTGSKNVVHCLQSLAQLDIDAIHAYSSAIERIDLSDVKKQLIHFRADHERHVSDLSTLIGKLGGNPPKTTLDFKGFLIQGFTAIRSMIGNESALKAMKMNEELTNKNYYEALEFDLQPDVKAVVQKNYEDERRHLKYIRQCIENRVWEIHKKSAA